MIRLKTGGKYHYATVEVLLTINMLVRQHRLLLDTGAFGLVMGSDRAVLHDLDLRSLSPSDGLSVGGPTRFRSVTAGRLEFLSPLAEVGEYVAIHQIGNVEVSFTEPPINFRKINVDGLIGTRELTRIQARVSVNYLNGNGGIQLLTV